MTDPSKIKAQKRRHYLKHRTQILEYAKKYRESHREEFNAYKRGWEKRNRKRATEIRRNSRLKNIYRITPEELDALYVHQNGKCAICNNSESHGSDGKFKSLNVDHCHTSGKVRGLLCGKCNKGIGMFKDNPIILNNASIYLSKHEKQTTVLDDVRG